MWWLGPWELRGDTRARYRSPRSIRHFIHSAGCQGVRAGGLPVSQTISLLQGPPSEPRKSRFCSSDSQSERVSGPRWLKPAPRGGGAFLVAGRGAPCVPTVWWGCQPGAGTSCGPGARALSPTWSRGRFRGSRDPASSVRLLSGPDTSSGFTRVVAPSLLTHVSSKTLVQNPMIVASTCCCVCSKSSVPSFLCIQFRFP